MRRLTHTNNNLCCIYSLVFFMLCFLNNTNAHPKNIDESCYKVKIQSVRAIAETDCNKKDGMLKLFFQDQNLMPSDYLIRFKNKKGRTFEYKSNETSPITIRRIGGGVYTDFQILRLQDNCKSKVNTLEADVLFNCNAITERSATCGEGTFVYENCDGQATTFDRAFITPETYIAVDNDPAMCIAYVNSDCSFTESIRAYCCDYDKDLPVGSGYNYGDVHFLPYEGEEGLSLSGLTRLEGTRCAWVIENASRYGYDAEVISDREAIYKAIWGIKEGDAYTDCNELCAAAKEEVTVINPDAIDNLLIYVPTNVSNVQPFITLRRDTPVFNCKEVVYLEMGADCEYHYGSWDIPKFIDTPISQLDDYDLKLYTTEDAYELGLSIGIFGCDFLWNVFIYKITGPDDFQCRGIVWIVPFNELVWPGDTNSSGVVDHADLLNIGLGYNEEGSARAGASIDWEGQEAPEWDKFFNNDVNYKHADANGDGIINYQDVSVVVANWRRTHATFTDEPANNLGIRAARSNEIPLYVSEKVLTANTKVQLPIILGSADQFVEEAYGLALSIKYDPNIIDANSVEIKYIDSWLGKMGTDVMAIQQNFPEAGRIDIAFIGIDHVDKSGYGQIATLEVQLKDEDFATMANQDIPFNIYNTQLINTREERQEVVGLFTVSVIEDGLVSNAEVLEVRESKLLYPNPARNTVYIQPSTWNIESIEIYTIQGQLLEIVEATNVEEIAVESLEKGLYIFKINTDTQTLIEKITLL